MVRGRVHRHYFSDAYIQNSVSNPVKFKKSPLLRPKSTLRSRTNIRVWGQKYLEIYDSFWLEKEQPELPVCKGGLRPTTFIEYSALVILERRNYQEKAFCVELASIRIAAKFDV
jgi:hypothetical protein